jgi:hypothetical protein
MGPAARTMRHCTEVRMTAHDTPPARPTAAWISRYATGLLNTTPGLLPLDAVRLAMDASGGTAAGRAHEASKPSVHLGVGQR